MNVLVLGKFLPLHNGHLALFEFARQYGDLTIVIGPRWDEPFSAEIRKKWIAMRTPSETKIVITRPDLPSKPEHVSSPELFWKLWREELNRIAPNIDIVVSSESYGERLATELGAKHIAFDPNRKMFPITATEIRDDDFRYDTWNYLSDGAKHSLRKLVVVVGGECCGKTTLIERLVKENPELYTPLYEYGRQYMEGRTMDEFTAEDAEHIASIQDIGINLTWQDVESKPIVISDTNALCSMVWCEMANQPVSHGFRQMTKSTVPDLTILCAPTNKWINDGTREYGSDEMRWGFYNKFRNYLDQYRRNYIIVSADDNGILDAGDEIMVNMINWNRNIVNWRE